jgi:hypothetical protein
MTQFADKRFFLYKRFFLSTDNDSHWYVIPIAHRGDWEEFLEIDSDDERSWTVPKWAEAVGGSPTLVTFSDPVVLL